MTAPRTGFPYLDEPRQAGHVLALAHRGGAKHPEVRGLENTLSAFRHAVGLGYRYLETDVHATRDGHLLAFHDRSLDRVTGQNGRIDTLPYATVKTALVDGREPIPRLEDLLEEFPDARFNVDLKTPGAVQPLLRLLRRTGAHHRLCVGSFTDSTLRAFVREADPRVAVSCGVARVVVDRLLPASGLLDGLLRDRGAVYQVPWRRAGVDVVDRRFVERAHARGRHVHVWTVDDRAEMEHLLDLGVDGLITDRTDVLKELLVERGLWEGTP